MSRRTRADEYRGVGVAKDSNVSTGTRLTAAKDMVGDKIDESKHDVSIFFRMSRRDEKGG